MKRGERINLCRTLISEQKSEREICHFLGMSSKTVTAVRSGLTSEDLRPVGRPRAVNQEMMRYMDDLWSINALISDDQMCTMINARFGTHLSRPTITRRRRELRYEYRPPKVIQNLSPEQRAIRVEFCRFVLERREEYRVIVFSDESRFARGPDNGWRRIKRGVYNETCFVEKEKFTQGVMVWGAIALGYRTNLMLCSGHVDSLEYRKVMQESNFIDDMNKLHGPGGWVYMQDGAPCHTASSTIEFFDSNRVLVLPGWPANSPDLNPIEMLWGIMKKKIRGNDLDLRAFADNLKELWHQIDQDVIDSLCSSFFKRCELVLQLDGRSATPYLRARKCPPPIAVDVRREWTDEDDQRIMAYVAEMGTKWTAIGNLMGERPNFVKYRYLRARQDAANQRSLSYNPLPPISEFQEPPCHSSCDPECEELLRDLLCKIGNQD